MSIYLWKPPMPMSIKELDQTYRRIYRRLTIGIAIIYGLALVVGLAVLVGNARGDGWASGGEPMRLAQPAKPIRTVRAD
jgi:hypothetical protein